MVPLFVAAAYATACSLLPAGSSARIGLSDLGLVALEIVLLVLALVVFLRAKRSPDRWIWLLLITWALGNLIGDSIWSYYEVIRQVEVPAPGPADIGYFLSYLVPIGIILVANSRRLGRLRSLETTLDAAIFTLGAAGLAWALLLEPMLREGQGGLAFWVDFAYPVLDILLVFAFVALLFGDYTTRNRRPPFYLLTLVIAFVFQVAADSAYLLVEQYGAEYAAGGWIDSLYTLSIAFAVTTAVLGIQSTGTTATPESAQRETDLTPTQKALPAWRAALPYVTLPVLAAMLSSRAADETWKWDFGTSVLVYMSVGMVFLLVSRQYVALLRNRSLYSDLAQVSVELEDRVSALADVNHRLEALNDSSHRLTSLRQPHAVARAGLEAACAFTSSPGGWISIGEGADYTVITHGIVEDYPHADPSTISEARQQGVLKAVPLTLRDEELGTMLLLTPPDSHRGVDLLPLVAAQVASALDNARRYEEALQLAERDPLTGLYNHRGIHRRLAGESLRAQQAGSELSLIMIDLDDFKVLNDTYGHVAGDSVLRQVSDAIRAVLRHADLAGRVGGDELLLVLPNTGIDGAMQLSERLRSALAARPYLSADGQSIPVYLSLGVATMPDDARSVGQLLETADSNLYASKQRGGNSTTGSATVREAPREEADGILGIAGRLLDAVGARDHYTRRHSEHVVLNALALGEAVGLKEGSLRTLHIAAMLHDVGNIGVPPELLRKPGPLTPSEEAQVGGHVLLGSDLVLDIPRLAEVAATVAAHHERYDGGGYPANAAADDIPLLGRILAVADAYSAMTLDRPYRQSMTRSQAKEELLKVAGTQLDPRLVDTFVAILDAREDDPTEEQAAAG